MEVKQFEMTLKTSSLVFNNVIPLHFTIKIDLKKSKTKKNT